MYLFEIGFVVHIVPGHHDDFVMGYGVGVMMIDEHAVDDSVA